MFKFESPMIVRVKKDIQSPLEKVWKKAKESFEEDKIHNIVDYAKSGMGDRGPLK